MRNISKSFATAALAVSLLAVPAYASAQPTKAAALSLAQGAAEASAAKPYCSSKITTDCRKRRAKGAWIALGVGALGGVIAAASDGGSVSP